MNRHFMTGIAGQVRDARYGEYGNALFLILIAVILFAALSYAIMQSSRGGGSGIGREEASLFAARFMQYATLAETAVNRMVIIGGVDPADLDFSDGMNKSALLANNNCLANTCKVYHPEGGGISAFATPVNAQAKGITLNLNDEGEAFSSVLLVSVRGIGTPLGDIVLLIRGLSDEVCEEINIGAGVYQRGDSPIAEVLDSFVHFQGDMNPLPAVIAGAIGNEDNRLEGRRTMCFFRFVDSGYYMLHVLYAR